MLIILNTTITYQKKNIRKNQEFIPIVLGQEKIGIKLGQEFLIKWKK